MNQLFKSTILTIVFALIGMSISAQCCNSDWNYTIPYQEIKDMDINSRNLLFFKVESDQTLLFQGRVINSTTIREIVKEYIKNEDDYYDMPRSLSRSCYDGGRTITMRHTEYVIFLLKDASVSPEDKVVCRALHEIVEAIAELRSEYSKRYFGVDFVNSSMHQRNIIEELLPCKIYFGNHKFTPPPPPPPAIE